MRKYAFQLLKSRSIYHFVNGTPNPAAAESLRGTLQRKQISLWTHRWSPQMWAPPSQSKRLKIPRNLFRCGEKEVQQKLTLQLEEENHEKDGFWLWDCPQHSCPRADVRKNIFAHSPGAGEAHSTRVNVLGRKELHRNDHRVLEKIIFDGESFGNLLYVDLKKEIEKVQCLARGTGRILEP